jgi:hypothetical protein
MQAGKDSDSKFGALPDQEISVVQQQENNE